MSRSVGDGVLTFLGDASQLQQVFAQIPQQAEAAMAKAAGAVGILNLALDATGENVAFAGEKFPQLISNWDLTGDAAKSAGVNAVAFGAEAAEGVEVANKVIREGKGELGLLGELFGIHLPRHVRSFIAELPGVGTALSAAFAATAIFFIIEALIKGIEKIQEFADHAEKIQQAWDVVDKVQRTTFDNLQNDLLRSEIAVDELSGNHLEALRLKLQLIDNTSLSKLTDELEKISAEIDKAFAEAGKYGGLERFFGIENATPNIQAQFDDIRKAAEEALRPKTAEAYADAIKVLDSALNDAQKHLSELRAQDEEFAKQSAEHPLGGTIGTGVKPVDPLTLQSWEQLTKSVEAYKEHVETAQQTEAKDKTAEQMRETARAASEAERETNKVAAAQKKADEAVIHSINDRISEEQRLYKKSTDDSLKSVEMELAARKKADQEIAQLAHQKMEGQIASIDGEMAHLESTTQRKAELLKFQYDTGIISGQQYLVRVKQLYNDERDALINLLNQKQQLVIQEAIREAAARGQTLTVAEAKELKAFIDLETKKQAVIDKSMTAIDKDVQRITSQAAKARPTWDKFFDDLIKGSHRSGDALKTLGQLTAQAIGDSVAAAVSGSQSFGQAMQQMLKSVLSMLAGKAVVKVLEELAEAFSALANPFTAALAPGHFQAAGAWAAVAAAAGAAGAALGGGGSGGGGGAGNQPQIDQKNPNNQPAQNPPQGGRNVPHLAGGGLITAPTLAMIGEGGSREAVLPLDSAVMDAIGEAIARHHAETGGGTTHIWQIKGMVSSDTAAKLMKKMSRQVQTGRARLLSNDALKTTRRA